MLLLRFVVGIPLVVALVFGLLYFKTRDPKWLRRGVVLFKWTVLAALGFFAVLFAQQFFSA